MNSEEIKNEFITCIEGTHTLNLAIEVLYQRDLYKSIIKEVREYIKDKWEMELKDSIEDFLDHDDLIDRKRLLHILEILDKVNELEEKI